MPSVFVVVYLLTTPTSPDLASKVSYAILSAAKCKWVWLVQYQGNSGCVVCWLAGLVRCHRWPAASLLFQCGGDWRDLQANRLCATRETIFGSTRWPRSIAVWRSTPCWWNSGFCVVAVLVIFTPISTLPIPPRKWMLIFFISRTIAWCKIFPTKLFNSMFLCTWLFYYFVVVILAGKFRRVHVVSSYPGTWSWGNSTLIMLNAICVVKVGVPPTGCECSRRKLLHGS